MKFKKVNNKVIKCFVTKDELDAYGVELEDLMCNRDKAEDFLEHLMMEARYELDFKVTSQALAVQINVMPTGDLDLTISDKEDLESVLDSLSGKVDKLDGIDKLTQNQEPKPQVNFDGPAWVSVDDLDLAIRLCKKIGQAQFVMSQLYKYDGMYFIRFALHNNKNLGTVFISCAEYGQEIFLDKTGGSYILEHGKCIIDEDAIFTLASV